MSLESQYAWKAFVEVCGKDNGGEAGDSRKSLFSTFSSFLGTASPCGASWHLKPLLHNWPGLLSAT